MRTPMIVSIVLTLLSTIAFAIEQQRSVDVFAWPLSDNKPQTFATISYNSTSASVRSFKTPKIPSGDDIVRVGFNHASGEWSGIATSSSNFDQNKDKKLQLHLNADGQIYHIGFSVKAHQSSSKSSNNKDGLAAEVIPMKPAPVVHMNKPVVLNAEGKPEDVEAEKTFFQKYWWVAAGFLIFQLIATASGGDGK